MMMRKLRMGEGSPDGISPENQMTGAAGQMSPCAACKLLRRRCTPDCIFAPYFPAHQPHKFASVHKVFGASNVNKMLQELPEHHRSDAVSSMVYEANARVRDPVYGCVGAISCLQQQVDRLQKELALAQAEVVQLRLRQYGADAMNPAASNSPDTASPSSCTYNNAMASQSRSFFSMDQLVDEASVRPDDSLWSC
ncbi:hypothetical protein SAY87_021781 [Trapa incisa]|uniref:LOB domain-containing protein n=2 Tax=Trapa TaxID=22665 RepID=A0AAN7RH76_TRANT|nr:hypothetical protein SAY87_021781 [Trapa incisa]KAK4803837.1 hypothetical protein SAY86_003654 [Trapa natans]